MSFVDVGPQMILTANGINKILGDGVVLALRGVNLNPDADPEDMVAIRLWVEADRVISARRRPLISMSDLVESLKQRPVTGPGDLIVRLADAAEQRMSDVIDDLEKSVSDLEQIVMQEPDQACRSSLGEVRKTAIALRRHLAPQDETARSTARRVPWARPWRYGAGAGRLAPLRAEVRPLQE